MKPLRAQLARLAAVAGLATTLTVIAGLWLSAMLLESYSNRQLSPTAIAALEKGGELPPAVEAELREVEKKLESIVLVEVLVWGLVGLAVGGLVGWRYARRLVAPLAELARTARQLRHGELGARVPAGTTQVREFDEFISDFNRMAQALQAAERERQGSSAAIAHELRTPLTVLHGRLSGMQDGVFPLSREGLQPLLAQTELLSRIVDDLRLLTLANARRLALDLSLIGLADQARTVVAAMRSLVDARGWVIVCELEPVMVQADGARLRQALQALIDNALRYGQGPLTVQTRLADGMATLCVLDRGPGLPPGSEAHAFDRYWRADDSRGREGGGSGLGLSVVQAIAQAHGGSAFYAPREGGGAVFGLALPVGGPPG
ncbi:MAG: ATP-binding protein [Pseudomonadota bacterium]|nr:ATP-binding protein [Pseudomonadota bacterium]